MCLLYRRKENASNITLKWKSNCGDSVFFKDSKRAERIFLEENVSKNKKNQRYEVYTITIEVILANAQKIIPLRINNILGDYIKK
jgi:hypothetical protein